MRFSFLVLIALFGYNCVSFAQPAPAPKRELRAVWIATVSNIDWPSKKGLSAQQQRQEFINDLDFLQSCGFNAVIVQVRPAADAFYPSPYEPWSVYLTGKQGQPPFPKYDPLAFMIEETHRRNMEFHAWFNPFRALVNSNVNPNPPEHATRQHPDWVINYGGKSYFDPGNPEARNYILKVILDVVKRYDIDGVHIDDYFYPYRIPGKTFNDSKSFQKYNNGLGRDDWRRNNVNLFISQLNNIIKAEKTWVKFGVSPFGIWRNQKDDPEGSATNGASCYDDLYSDIKLWLKKKWIDYAAPQLYWECGNRNASFDVLLPWWMNVRGNTQIYIGLGIYRMLNANKGPWVGTTEILKQIRMARALHADGLVFYSMSNFSKITPALTDSLRYKYFGTIAIPPAMPWIKHPAMSSPRLFLTLSDTGALLQWQEKPEAKQDHKYLVYRFAAGEKVDLEDPGHILVLTQHASFLDKDYQTQKKYRYVITALDRLWNESPPSNIVGDTR
jgi:uncharacterized lipoprotein YddW (UPF0748 family)